MCNNCSYCISTCTICGFWFHAPCGFNFQFEGDRNILMNNDDSLYCNNVESLRQEAILLEHNKAECHKTGNFEDGVDERQHWVEEYMKDHEEELAHLNLLKDGKECICFYDEDDFCMNCYNAFELKLKTTVKEYVKKRN